MNKVELQENVPDQFDGERLDRTLALIWPEYSRAQFKQWIIAGEVTVDSNIITLPRHTVYAGQPISVSTHIDSKTDWQAEGCSSYSQKP